MMTLYVDTGNDQQVDSKVYTSLYNLQVFDSVEIPCSSPPSKSVPSAS